MFSLSYIENKYKESKILHTITIELLNHCNWNCMHCYLDRDKIVMQNIKFLNLLMSLGI